VATFLLAFGALFSIVNPLSGAFIFFGATQGMEPKTRAAVSRWVGIYAFCIVAASLYVGAYVLSFFGISIPVLRVAGGIVVSMSGWRMLNEPDATEQRRSEAPAYPRSIDTPPSRLAFYPLTMPLTTGPGTISVAISIGAGRPGGTYASLISFFIETLAATLLLVLLVYGSYRNSGRSCCSASASRCSGMAPASCSRICRWVRPLLERRREPFRAERGALRGCAS
jgi:multiple antibiotic resistance protein